MENVGVMFGEIANVGRGFPPGLISPSFFFFFHAVPSSLPFAVGDHSRAIILKFAILSITFSRYLLVLFLASC